MVRVQLYVVLKRTFKWIYFICHIQHKQYSIILFVHVAFTVRATGKLVEYTPDREHR